MFPDNFSDLEKTVEQYASGRACEGTWVIDSREEGDPDRLNGYPFATAKAVGVHLTYEKKNVTLAADISSNPKASWRDFFPSVTWRRAVSGTRHECVLSSPGLCPTFAYKFLHPDFTVSSSTRLKDKLFSELTATTRLSEMNHLGVSALYDPSRSGLIDYTALFARKGCAVVYGGDMVLKYNATRGLGVHTRIPVNSFLSTILVAETQRFLVGAAVCSPCGAQIHMNVNVADSQAGITATRNIDDMWKVRLSTSFSLLNPGSAKMGVVFTNCNAL